ncbi:DsbA family protein [Candidatus Woesearchaeota archaeon]|nr:MAG: DsbA family protein [Candidatus Woesearchaeota archaeon]
MNKKLLLGIGIMLIASVFYFSFAKEPDISNVQVIEHVKGLDTALVEIIEFSDYECPFCVRFARQTLPMIKEKYIDTGKVKFIFKDYPLKFHKFAQKAAEAAECASDQGKYYAMHDMLFSRGVGKPELYKQYAKELGLNEAEFNSCLDSGKYENAVKAEMEQGKKLGVKGTPYFIINGKVIKGAQPFDVFEEVIEQALAEA